MGQLPSVSPLEGFGGSSGSAPVSRFGDMQSEDFIEIMFTELSNQDPFEPSDSGALLEQLNTIRSIEADIALQDNLNRMVLENQMASAANLLGKFVGGMTAGFDRVAGNVVGVIREGDTVSLELDGGWIVPFENIETIIDADSLGDPGGGGDPPGGGGDPPGGGGDPPGGGGDPPGGGGDPPGGGGDPPGGGGDPPGGGGDPPGGGGDPYSGPVTPQPKLTPNNLGIHDPGGYVRPGGYERPEGYVRPGGHAFSPPLNPQPSLSAEQLMARLNAARR